MQFVGVSYLANVFFIGVSSNIASLTASRTAVVLIGNKVVLKCSVTGNDSLAWKYTSWKTSRETDIYWGGDIITTMRSRYKIDKRLNGHHNLIIDSADLAHAGRYQCTTIMQQTLMTDIHLAILGSHPACAATFSEIKNDGQGQTHLPLSILCSISYTGNGFPVFNWTKSNVVKNITANTTTSDNSRGAVTNSSSIIEQQLHPNDSGVTFQCNITFQMPNNSGRVNVFTWDFTPCGPLNLSIARYEDRLECSADGNPAPNYKWIHDGTNTSTEGHVFLLNGTHDKDHTFQCTAANIFAAENKIITIQGPPKDSGGTQGVPITALVIGGSLLFLLIIAIIVSCVVLRKRLKDDTTDRPDVALNTDLNSYDEIALSSDRSANYIMEGDHSTGRSDDRTIADNVVYSEVWKPNGRSNGSSGDNHGENSRPLQSHTREKKNLIGADGTEYAELSGVKPPARKGEVPKPPAFSRVEVYASIDHNGRAPPPPPKL